MSRAMTALCVGLAALATAAPCLAGDTSEGQLDGIGPAGTSFNREMGSPLLRPLGAMGLTSPNSAGVEEGTARGAESSETQGPWAEEPNESYRFVGVRGRYVVVPAFMFDLYQADGGSTVTSPGIGLEYGVRRNGFEIDTWLMYASYPMSASPFKAKSDPDQAYEIVKSELKTLTIGADLLWSVPIDNGFSFIYGAGAGLGLVFGDLYRNQAYPPTGLPSNPDTYVKCPGPGAGPGDYCGADNDHYGSYTEPSWLDGGSKPVVFPWIALPQVGVRWKPSPQFAMRLDTGLSFPGPFFFGLSGQYGLL